MANAPKFTQEKSVQSQNQGMEHASSFEIGTVNTGSTIFVSGGAEGDSLLKKQVQSEAAKNTMTIHPKQGPDFGIGTVNTGSVKFVSGK